MPKVDFFLAPKRGFDKLFLYIFGTPQKICQKPPSLAAAVQALTRLTLLFSMFDNSNPLIILFTPELTELLGGCSAVHVFDLTLLLADCFDVTTSFIDALPVARTPPIWCPSTCVAVQNYLIASKIKPSDLVNLYLQPKKDLNDFLQCVSKGPITYKAKNRLKLLRMVRIVLRYVQAEQLVLPNGFKNAIYCADSKVQQALKINYFHGMDGPFLILGQCYEASPSFSTCRHP